MRTSLVFALAAGTTALDHVNPGFHVGHVEARQTQSISRPELVGCASAMRSLVVAGQPTPPPELLSFSSSKRAALTGPVTDFCQIFSSIPAELTSIVSDFEKTMESFNSWMITEIPKIPTSVCPSPPATSNVIVQSKVACTSGERRRIPGGFPTSTDPAQAACNSINRSVFSQRPSPPPEFTSYYAQLASTRTFTDACEQLSHTYPPSVASIASAYTSTMNSWSSWMTSEFLKHTSECPSYALLTPTPSLEEDCAKGIKRPIGGNTTNTGPSTPATGTPTPAPNATTGGAGGSPPVPTTAQPAAAASNVVAAGFAAVAFIGAVVAL